MSPISDPEVMVEARKFVKSDQFSLALSLMINELKLFPGNLPLLANIASCYYMTGNYLLFKKYSFDLLECYEKEKRHFKPKEMRPTMLALVRLFEELGEISICLKVMKDYVYDQERDFDKHDVLLLAQKLRLFSSFPSPENNLSEIYNQCRFLNDKSKDSYLDLESALLQADWSLFGEGIASDRFYKFIKRGNVLESQHRLVLFDHLYESLKLNNGINFKFELLKDVVYLEADPFERLLWDMLLASRSMAPFAEVSLTRTDELSPFGAVKMLHLLLLQTDSESLRQEISRKIGFHLNDVTALSRSLILKAFPVEQKSTTIEILKDHIEVNGRMLSTQRCKSVYKLLSEMQDGRFLATDTAIQKLLGEVFDTSSYAKMRVLVSRANIFLMKNSGFSKAISITKETIQLNSQLQIVKRI